MHTNNSQEPKAAEVNKTMKARKNLHLQFVRRNGYGIILIGEIVHAANKQYEPKRAVKLLCKLQFAHIVPNPKDRLKEQGVN